MTYTAKYIYGIILLIIMNIDMLLQVFKIKNISNNADNLDFIYLGLALFFKTDITFYVVLVYVISKKIYRYVNAEYSYTISNITNNNLEDFKLITAKHLTTDKDIFIEHKKSSIIIKIPRRKKQIIKPMLKEINYYLRGNGTVSLSSVVQEVVVFAFTIFIVYDVF